MEKLKRISKKIKTEMTGIYQISKKTTKMYIHIKTKHKKYFQNTF